MPDSTLSTLGSIRTKIRRLTKSPGESQLPTNTIDTYINSFILYDMPPDVSLNSLKKVLRFYTEPYIESYSTSETETDALYNFKNNYALASNTVFIGGDLAYFTESRSDFYQRYPRTNQQESIGTGDDVTTNFTGTLTGYPVYRNNVVFASKNVVDAYIKMYDDGNGTFEGDGAGGIDYITGVYDIIFTTAPATGEDVYCQRATYRVSKPNTILYFQDTFYLRPIPDKAYPVEVEVYQRPTELIDAGQLPDLSEWWEYIAIGSARKILIDRADYDTATILERELAKKEEHVLYKTIMQNSMQDGYGV
jgi:hypothetical protein